MNTIKVVSIRVLSSLLGSPVNNVQRVSLTPLPAFTVIYRHREFRSKMLPDSLLNVLDVAGGSLLFHDPGNRRLGTVEQLRNLLQGRAFRFNEEEPDAETLDDQDDNVHKVKPPGQGYTHAELVIFLIMSEQHRHVIKNLR